MRENQPNAIRTLQNEHKTMAYLLDLLERQISLFEKTKRPDYELIKEVVDYFLTYPDLCHHPKEDMILRKLRARDPGAAERLLDLETEHQKGSHHLGEFSRAVVNILLDAEISRETFIGIANQFIEGERAHMAAEEKEFFPVALRCLLPEDWAEIDGKIDRFRDPLSGPGQGNLRFGLLHDRLSAQRHSQAT